MLSNRFFTARALFCAGKPKVKIELLLKSVRTCGTRVTLAVRVKFAKFLSVLQNLSLELNRKSRQQLKKN